MRGLFFLVIGLIVGAACGLRLQDGALVGANGERIQLHGFNSFGMNNGRMFLLDVPLAGSTQ